MISSPDSGRWHTLTPFAHRMFLAVWLGNFMSNVGGHIQAVAAAWLMLLITPDPQMVALVVAANSMPMLLLSPFAGALADTIERRTLMLMAQASMCIASCVLATIAFSGTVTPLVLLGITFTIGCGSAINGPAWQASIGDFVPRSALSAAIGLNVAGFNLARTIGPAAGGVIVALAGPKMAFAVNAASYIVLIGVLVAWTPARAPLDVPQERVWRAVAAGIRFARHSNLLLILNLRALLFGICFSAIFALAPLIARDLLAGGARTYGMLAAGVGVGAVIGATFSATFRVNFSNESILRCAVAGSALALVGCAASRHPIVSTAVMIGAGTAMVLALSTFNYMVQTAVPRWIIGRCVALYQMSMFGGMAAGGWIWGYLSATCGLVCTLCIASGCMAAGLIVAFRLPLANMSSGEHSSGCDTSLPGYGARDTAGDGHL